MTLALQDLYQELVRDHARSPRNRRSIEHACASCATGHNPLCGDRIEVFIRLDGEVIGDISFEGEGCAISTASASLMTEQIRGKPIEEALALADRFQALVTGKETRGDDLEDLGMLAGVSRFPMRVKCATLAWHTLRAAIEGRERVTTEGRHGRD